MKRSTFQPNRGSALLIVLGSLVLCGALVVAFLGAMQLNFQSSKAYSDNEKVQRAGRYFGENHHGPDPCGHDGKIRERLHQLGKPAGHDSHLCRSQPIPRLQALFIEQDGRYRRNAGRRTQRPQRLEHLTRPVHRLESTHYRSQKWRHDHVLSDHAAGSRRAGSDAADSTAIEHDQCQFRVTASIRRMRPIMPAPTPPRARCIRPPCRRNGFTSCRMER